MRFANLTPRGVLTASTVNDLVLTSVKWSVGQSCHSTILVADAEHSLGDIFVDVGSIFLVNRHSVLQKAFTRGVAVLLAIAAATLFREAMGPRTTLPKRCIKQIMAVQGLVVISKEALYHTMIRLHKTCKSMTLLSAARHQRSDVIASLSFASGALLQVFGLTMLDRCATILAALSIVRMSLRLSFDT